MTPAHWCSQVQPMRLGAKTSTVTSNVPIYIKYFPPAIVHLSTSQFDDVKGLFKKKKLICMRGLCIGESLPDKCLDIGRAFKCSTKGLKWATMSMIRQTYFGQM